MGKIVWFWNGGNFIKNKIFLKNFLFKLYFWGEIVIVLLILGGKKIVSCMGYFWIL